MVSVASSELRPGVSCVPSFAVKFREMSKDSPSFMEFTRAESLFSANVHAPDMPREKSRVSVP